MITQEFEFRSPEKLDEALTLLADGGEDIKLLSGGMSLMPMMALGLVRPRIVLSLNRIDGRGYVREDRDALRIGAGTRHYEILHDPLIARHCGVLSRGGRFHRRHAGAQSRHDRRQPGPCRSGGGLQSGAGRGRRSRYRAEPAG